MSELEDVRDRLCDLIEQMESFAKRFGNGKQADRVERVAEGVCIAAGARGATHGRMIAEALWDAHRVLCDVWPNKPERTSASDIEVARQMVEELEGISKRLADIRARYRLDEASGGTIVPVEVGPPLRFNGHGEFDLDEENES